MTYDKPITLQVQDDATEAWTDALHLHARVNKSNAGESFNAAADQYHVTLSFDIRYVSALERIAYGIQPYRILYRGRTFKVTDYDDYMEQHRTVRLIGVLYGA